MGTSLGQRILIIHDEGTIEELDLFDFAPVERGTLERGAVEALSGELHRFYSITY